MAARDSWLAHVKSGLPIPWKNALEEAVPEPETIRRQLGNKIRAVPIGRVSRSMLWGLLAGLVVFAACLVLAIVGIPSDSIPVRAGMVVLGLLVGAAFFFVGRSKQLASGQLCAREFGESARSAVSLTTTEQLVNPSAAVLNRHRTAREALRV